MKITNRYNLPAGLVAAVAFSDRNREGCDYTITELLTPPRVLALTKLFADKVEEDAADRLWALLGQAGHEVLRRFGKQTGKAIVEERAHIEVKVDRTYKIGGQLDYLANEERTLDDFKFVSVWGIKEGLKPEWEAQLNLYRWLAWHYGIPVDLMRIIAIARDWSVREARRDPSYPQEQVKVFTVKPWSWERCEAFCRERIIAHEAAKVILPECTAAEMWEKPECFAAKKRGNKRATRVFYSAFEASEFVVAKGLEVERRPGQRPRCESYCAVSPFCAQYLQWQSQQELREDTAND